MPAQRLEYVVAYEVAVAQGSDGAYLPPEGLDPSQITEWRPRAEQSEIARLRRQLDVAERRR